MLAANAPLWQGRPGRFYADSAGSAAKFLPQIESAGFSRLLSDLDLHHPPCEKWVANQMFYAVGVLAYNLLIALRVFDLPDEAQGGRPRTLLRKLLAVPVKVGVHARYRRATLGLPAGWMRWWRLFLQDHGPKRTHGGARVGLEESGG